MSTVKLSSFDLSKMVVSLRISSVFEMNWILTFMVTEPRNSGVSMGMRHHSKVWWVGENEERT